MVYSKKGKINRKDHKNDWKTKRKTKDLDEIDADLLPEKRQKLINQEFDPEQVGGAQWYCVHCARYFVSEDVMKGHFRSKPHKKRLKQLIDEPYSIEESERAAGMGSYIPPKKRKMETQKDEEKIEVDLGCNNLKNISDDT